MYTPYSAKTTAAFYVPVWFLLEGSAGKTLGCTQKIQRAFALTEYRQLFAIQQQLQISGRFCSQAEPALSALKSFGAALESKLKERGMALSSVPSCMLCPVCYVPTKCPESWKLETKVNVKIISQRKPVWYTLLEIWPSPTCCTSYSAHFAGFSLLREFWHIPAGFWATLELLKELILCF